MPMWEYCVLTGIVAHGPNGFDTTEHPRLFYFKADKGITLVGFTKEDQTELVASTIAVLGNEGWELVSVVGSSKHHTLYFKRSRDDSSKGK